MNRLRNKIRVLLIKFANWIGDGSYYDLGEPITGMIKHGDNVFISTSTSIWMYDGETYKHVEPKKGNL